MHYNSILNDVMGPVTTGPSSSHTAAPARIGRAVSLLWGQKIKRVNILFDESGSYPNTYVGQGADIGFAGGLMGYLPESPELKSALRLAKEKGVEIRFLTEDLGAHHPNEARIDVLGENGAPQMSVLSFSTGGGTLELSELDGFSISYRGQRKKAYIAAGENAAESVEQALSRASLPFSRKKADPLRSTFHTNPAREKGGAVLYEVSFPAEGDASALEGLSRQPGVYYVRVLGPVVPVSMRENPAPPFCSAKEALEFAGANKSMPELAILYECALGEITPAEVRKEMGKILAVMRAAISPPTGEKSAIGVMGQSSEKMARNAEKRRIADLGVLGAVLPAASSVMENSCARGIVAAAPTAGASGVLPAVLVAVGEKMGFSDESLVDALLAAGLVGSFIANHATFGAEVAGCQAEIGAASSMAAAGMVQLLGGSMPEAFRAAAIALQSFLGLICDPVGGITEIPCIARNVTASAVAVTAANMAVCGFDPIIPLDETIFAMLEVGKALPGELKCTCKGGLCTTPTGQELNRILRGKEGA